MKDGRGILDLRGGTGGTGLVVGNIEEVFLLVNELFDVDETRDLFNGRASDTDVDSLIDGGTRPLFSGTGGCGRPLARNVVDGFFNAAILVDDGSFVRLKFIVLTTVGFDFVKVVGIDFVLMDVSDKPSRNVGDGRGKSESSRFNESDFDVTDNELTLR